MTVGVGVLGIPLGKIHKRAVERALDLIQRTARVTPDELREASWTPDRFGDMGW